MMVGPLKDPLLPMAYLAYVPRGMQWTKTHNGVGHVAEASLEMQARIWEAPGRRPLN